MVACRSKALGHALQNQENNYQDNMHFKWCTILFPIFIQNTDNVPLYYTHFNIPQVLHIDCIHQNVIGQWRNIHMWVVLH